MYIEKGERNEYPVNPRKREKSTHLPTHLPTLVIDILLDPLGGHGLGALEGQAQGTVPEDLGKRAQGAGDTEEHRVVVELLEAVCCVSCWEEGGWMKRWVEKEMGRQKKEDKGDVQCQRRTPEWESTLG